MARRSLLTKATRQELFGIQENPEYLARFYTLTREDHDLIRTRRRDGNRLGLAIHIALLRHSGHGWIDGADIPERFIAWLSEQLTISNVGLAEYVSHRKKNLRTINLR